MGAGRCGNIVQSGKEINKNPIRCDSGMKTAAHTNGQVCSAHVRMPHQHLSNVATEFHKKKFLPY